LRFIMTAMRTSEMFGPKKANIREQFRTRCRLRTEELHSTRVPVSMATARTVSRGGSQKTDLQNCVTLYHTGQKKNKKIKLYIVAYRPVAKQRLCKQRPLLGNARNMHARYNRRTVFSVVRAAAISGQRLGKHVPAATVTNVTIKERCLLCGPCRNVITRTAGAISIDSSAVSSISQRQRREHGSWRISIVESFLTSND
jgi:hypothetical protein